MTWTVGASTALNSFITEEALSYDSMGRIVQRWSSAPSFFLSSGLVYTQSFWYDLAGNRTSMVDGTGRTFNYSYDGAGRLLTASNTVTLSGNTPTTAITPMVSNMTYYPSGRPQSMSTTTSGATITGAWVIDNRLRVTSYQNTSTANSGNTNYGYSLTYYPNSNVHTDNETVYDSGAVSWSWTYNYDTLNRLINATSSGARQFGCVETIDQFGNRTEQAPYGGTGYSCSSASNPVTAGTNRPAGNYNPDNAGNVQYDGYNHLTYDAEGRIATSTPSGGGPTSYTYDAEGQRVSKTSGGTETDFVRDLDGTLLNTYVSGSYIDQPQEMWIAGRHYGTVYVANNNGVQEQGEGLSLTNWLGSEAMRSFAVSNGGNTGIPTYAFLSQPFGDGQTEIVGSGDCDDIHFTGRERDTESGNDYFGARYYSSAMGRFLIPDWSAKIEPVPYSKLDNPQSLNLYSYVGNNPLGNVDTDGHACFSLNSSSGFCTRATEYGQIDARPAIQSQTRFFAAADAVSQSLGDVAVPVLSRFEISSQTANFLEGVGENLQKLNETEANAIQNGTLSGPNLDQQLVHNEQSAVQGQLDNLQQSDPGAYKTAISEINAALNPGQVGQFAGTRFDTDKAYAGVLDGVRKDLGREIDFRKQSDREAIGNALIRHIRQTGGCDVNGKKQPGC